MKRNNIFFITIALITAGLSTHNSSTMVVPHLLTPLEKNLEKAVENGETEAVKILIKTNSQLRNKLAADQNYANYWLNIAICSADNIVNNIMPLFSHDEEKLELSEKEEKAQWMESYHAYLTTAYVLTEFGAQQSHLMPKYQDMLNDIKTKKVAALEHKKKASKTYKGKKQNKGLLGYPRKNKIQPYSGPVRIASKPSTPIPSPKREVMCGDCIIL